MSFPKFSAESALYNTTEHYRMRGGFAYSSGMAVQQFLPIRDCGPCYWSNGSCVQDCSICTPCPPGVKPNGCGGCETFTGPCRVPGGCATPPPPCCPKGCVGVCP